ncbi:MAG: hypothetical protein AB7P08_17355 [Burkholderiales bacterium]
MDSTPLPKNPACQPGAMMICVPGKCACAVPEEAGTVLPMKPLPIVHGEPVLPVPECKFTVTFPPGRPDLPGIRFDSGGECVAGTEVALAVTLAALMKIYFMP